MSGDYSRFVFDPTRDYNGVLLEQGRPLTDWDWNAQVAQSNRRQQAGTFDTLGAGAVVPATTPDSFQLSFDGSGNLLIGRGRVYVDGLLAENHGTPPLAWDTALAEQYGTNPMPYLQQVPYLPNPPALPTTTGPHLVFLDIWEREVTQYQAADVLEKALGVDTTTRLQTVWQVRVLENAGDASLSCSSDPDDIPGWTQWTAPSGGLLTTATATYGSDNPCLIPPTGGYTGLENQLYRVEIHDAGAPGTATFKWSRDNASVQTRVNRIDNGVTLYVDSLGRDNTLGFNDGDWIEITDDWRELNGLPGQLRQIPAGGVNTATLSITLGTAVDATLFPVDGMNNLDPARNTRITRWDQGGTIILTDTVANTTSNVDVDAGPGTIQVPSQGTVTVTLENGIVVSFDLDATGNPFRSGDYWQFAARAVDASIELLAKAPPRGNHHHYAKLGFITIPGAVTDNCTVFWPPVTHEAAATATAARARCASRPNSTVPDRRPSRWRSTRCWVPVAVCVWLPANMNWPSRCRSLAPRHCICWGRAMRRSCSARPRQPSRSAAAATLRSRISRSRSRDHRPAGPWCGSRTAKVCASKD